MKVLLTGGGTGGHIYPALAVAAQCRRQDRHTELLYVGSETGLEKNIVPQENIPFVSIEISGFRRKLAWQNVATVLRFMRAVRRSRRLLREFRPDVVVGTGGYVAGPVVYAAARLGIPCLIHEQNAIPGLTNRFLGRYADCVAVSFEQSVGSFAKSKRVVCTGNPCATAVKQAQAKASDGRKSLDIPAGAQIVLIFGGSRGALALNRTMTEMIRHLPQLADVYFVYVTGKVYYEDTVGTIRQTGAVPDNVRIMPYVDNMPEVLAASTVAVTRAGASTLAEITALGIPSVLVPSPNVTGGHQKLNARALADKGAAVIIRESELDGEKLFQTVRRMLKDPIRLEHMRKQSEALGRPDAAERVYREMVRIARTSGTNGHK